MREGMNVNAMRSGVVVVGALAFGYLTLQLGFRPFLEKAQDTLDKSASAHPNDKSFDNAQILTESSQTTFDDIPSKR